MSVFCGKDREPDNQPQRPYGRKTLEELMNINQLKERAKELGVKVVSESKPELIRAIQKVEGNEACFGRNEDGHCEYSDCCFWSDCIVNDTLDMEREC